MKMLYVSNTRFPSERAHSAQIAHMCQGFADNDVDVTLVVNDRRENTGNSVEEYFGFKPNFRIERVHFGILFVPYSKVFFLMNNIFFSLFVLFSYKLRTYDFIFVRDEWIGFFLSFFVQDNKIVYESHDGKVNLPVKRLIKKNIKFVVTAIAIKELYIKMGIPSARILTAPNGIDKSFFESVETREQARTRLGLPFDKNIVLYIGGFDKWKGIETFFEASVFLPEVLFVVIGGKPEEIKENTKKYQNVLFLGTRPYSELKDNQQVADILVVPNTAQNEMSEKFTSPLKLFAHMASGIPIIASDIFSIKNILNNVGVLLFEPDNPRALVDAIKSTLENYDSQYSLAQKIKISSMKYTWKNRANKIVQFLKN